MSDNKTQSNDNKTHDSARDWYDYEPPLGHVTNYVTWKFNLDDPEGERRLRECLDASRVKFAIQKFDEWLRQQIKYHDGGRVYDDIRDGLHMMFERQGIEVWDD